MDSTPSDLRSERSMRRSQEKVKKIKRTHTDRTVFARFQNWSALMFPKTQHESGLTLKTLLPPAIESWDLKI